MPNSPAQHPASKWGVSEEELRNVVIRQLVNGPPPPIELPAAKFESPKLLCLDLNKWIDLSRFHYGRSNTPSHGAALDAIRKGKESKRLIVAITATNLQEVQLSSPGKRRDRLFRFMVQLADNIFVVDEKSVQKAELIQALRGSLGMAQASLRPHLIARGAKTALQVKGIVVDGGNAAITQLINDALDEPEISVRLLATAVDATLAQQIRRRKEDSIRRIAEARAVTPLAGRRLLELHTLFTLGPLALKLEQIAVGLGFDAPAFRRWLSNDQTIDTFARNVPSINVLSPLMLARDRNQDAPTQVNDGRDFSFLETAIPYANIVVTENLWSSLANSEGIARQYGTVVLQDVGDLPETLMALGCL